MVKESLIIQAIENEKLDGLGASERLVAYNEALDKAITIIRQHFIAMGEGYGHGLGIGVKPVAEKSVPSPANTGTLIEKSAFDAWFLPLVTWRNPESALRNALERYLKDIGRRSEIRDNYIPFKSGDTHCSDCPCRYGQHLKATKREAKTGEISCTDEVLHPLIKNSLCLDMDRDEDDIACAVIQALKPYLKQPAQAGEIAVSLSQVKEVIWGWKRGENLHETALAIMELFKAPVRESGNGWQPIQTHPKEAGYFLVYGHLVGVRRIFYDGHFMRMPNEGEEVNKSELTHWMPLPKPPITKIEDGASNA